MTRSKVVGGKFGFPITFPQKPSFPEFLTGNPALLSNARSGIKLIIDQLKPPQVWLPSYLCPTIISAIDQKISRINFFPISDSLTLVSDEFLSLLRPHDLFLFIDYFGFPFDEGIIEEVKHCGCTVLRDCSQALFFDFKNDKLSDFHLFSPRKFLGVPDGGILQMRYNHMLNLTSLLPPGDASFPFLFQALLLRREFDIYGGSRAWFDLFKKGEAFFSPGNYRMSELSEHLLHFAFNYHEIQLTRRQNFLYLLERLKHIALFSVLPESVVPLGFPIKVPDRDGLQKELFKYSIYPPIHWNIAQAVPEEFFQSHNLSQEIMTLPCDQRYDESDMEYIVNAIMELIG